MSYRRAYSATLAAIGLGVWATLLSGCQKKPAPPSQGPLPVNVVTVEEKQVTEWDEFTGRIEAVESVEIRARVSGYLQSVNFKAGAVVKAGDLLFVIDPRPYQADLDRAQAELDRTAAQLKLAEIDYRRAEDLRKKNTISAEEFDQKAAALRQAEAAVRSSTATKESAALNLEFTQIKSPIAGRVSNERVTVGNLVMTGDALLAFGANGLVRIEPTPTFYLYSRF